MYRGPVGALGSRVARESMQKHFWDDFRCCWVVYHTDCHRAPRDRHQLASDAIMRDNRGLLLQWRSWILSVLLWSLTSHYKRVWASIHSLAVFPTDFDMKYSLTLSGNIPAVFLHRFVSHTRPQGTPRGPYTKKRFFLHFY